MKLIIRVISIVFLLTSFLFEFKHNNLYSQDTKKYLSTSQSEYFSLPCAVPMAAPEEAEQYNAEAIDYFRRLFDKTVLEGEIVAISQCPDPETIDYPDCNLTATVQINDVSKTKISLVIPCIRNSRIIISDTMKEKSLIAFSLRDERTLSEEEEGIQLVDDNQDFELDQYYCDYLRQIDKYCKLSRYVMKSIEIIQYDPTIVLTDEDQKRKEKHIKNEIERLDKIISSFSMDDAKVFSDNYSEFIKDVETKQPYVEIEYTDGSKKIFPFDLAFPPKAFPSLALSNNLEKMKHNAKVTASIAKYLQERGISLLVVIVPHPYEAYIDRLHLSNKLSTYNINRVLYMKQLLQFGIDVLDIEPMIEDNLMSPFHYSLLFKRDFHPSEMGAYYYSQYIFDHLYQYDGVKNLIKNDYSAEIKHDKESILYHGEYFKDMDTISISEDSIPINKQSPLLFVGDSFTYTSHIRNYLAFFFKTKINPISRGGSLTTTAQLIQSRSSEISPNTKMCILFNTSCHLGGRFNDLVDEGIQIYPNSALNNTDNLYFYSKEMLNELYSFEINLPGRLVPQKEYIICVYTNTNDTNLEYNINIKNISLNRSNLSQNNYACRQLKECQIG